MKSETSNTVARPNWLAGAGRFAAMTAALFLAGGSASALSITLRDLADGDLIATTDLPGSVVVSRPGVTTVNGAVTIPFGGAAIPVGVHSVLLMDPGAGLGPPRVSDFMTLSVSAGVAGVQHIALLFESDAAAGFRAALAALSRSEFMDTMREPHGLPGLFETGALQDLSSFLDSGALSIHVQSERKSVPDSGSTVMLLAAGLLAVGGFARRANVSRQPA